MEYFNLYNHCYFHRGEKNAAVYDIFQKRIFWIEDSRKIDFLDMSRRGLSLSEISRRLSVEESLIRNFAAFYETVELGAFYESPKVSPKYRPFIHPHLEREKSFYRPLGVVSLEVSTRCTGQCWFCDSDKRLASLECTCGCFSNRPKIEYAIDEVIGHLACAAPASIELTGGDPFSNRADTLSCIMAASRHSIPVNVRTFGSLLTSRDIVFLKQYKASMSLVLSNFAPESSQEDIARISRILSWSAAEKYFDIDVVLLMDENHVEQLEAARQWFGGIGLPIRTVTLYYPVELLHATDNERSQRLKACLMSSPDRFAVDMNGLARNVKGHSCWQDHLCILSNGDVTPCLAERDHVYGNAKTENILDIIRGKRSEKLMGMTKQTMDERCAHCEVSIGCAPCSVATKKMQGSYEKPGWNCVYRPDIGRF